MFEQSRFLLYLLMKRQNPYDHDAFDQVKFDRIMARPLPENRYAIFFTPRSGSTRVSGLIQEAGLSNHPGEFFNPKLMVTAAANHTARNLPEYVQLIQRNRHKRGYFGFEITYAHLVANFVTGRRFMKFLRPDRTAWLVREDIVAQAVSVSRMQQTQVAHLTFADTNKAIAADENFEYVPQDINLALMRCLWMENRTEAFIRRQGLDVFRFSYEMTNMLGPTGITHLMAQKLGLPAPTGKVQQTHQKLPGQRGIDYAERFREENKGLLARVSARRAPLLRLIEQQKELYL